MAVYLIAMRLPKMEYVGTAAVFFMLLNLFKVPFMVDLGLITSQSFGFNLALAPAVLAGALAVASVAPDAPQLTPRERDVLRHLANGLSNEEIGKELYISPETVRTHIRKAMDKLGAETRTQAVATALRHGLIA